jgi:protein-disulfide isomerase
MVNARQAKTAREKAAAMRAEATRKESRRRAIAIVAAVVTVILVAVGAGVIIQIAKHNQEAKKAAASAPPANLTNDAFLAGNPSAKVTVTVYEDFICPACGNFEKLNSTQLAQWAKDGTAKVEYRPVAILDEQSSTEYSTRALNALAAVINAKPGSFAKFHELLFTNQPPEGGPGLPDSQLIEFAVQAGVDRAAVEGPINDRKYEGWTKKVTIAFTNKQKRPSTPTIAVNGKELPDYAPDKVKAAVEAAAKG